MRLQRGIMKGNRICIMACAQEIDRSISSASYHVAMHLPAFAFTGGGVELIENHASVQNFLNGYCSELLTQFSQLNKKFMILFLDTD
jgi:hypothetical protein